MSVDHTFRIGGDSSSHIHLNVSGVDQTGQRTVTLTGNLYAYDSRSGSSKFTCSLSIEELSKLYHHLRSYSVIRDSALPQTGKFIEVSGSSTELIQILSSSGTEQLISALKIIISNKLSNADLNIILGRRDALLQFEQMLNMEVKPSEPEWQLFFESNEWIFGYGLKYRYLKILQREAHISQTDLDGKNDVISDFLLSDARYTKLVELKTPDTPLFDNRRNRSDSWRLSTALTDAVSQILAQKANWEIESSKPCYTADGQLVSEATHDVECILVIGRHSNTHGTPKEIQMKSKTLELYRRNLRHIDILLYDELFERAKYIVESV